MGEASKLVSDAGYAGVDIHALYWGNLIDSFALAYMNLRDDERHPSLTALPALGIPCLHQPKHEAIRLCTNEERCRIRLERLLDEFDRLGIMPWMEHPPGDRPLARQVTLFDGHFKGYGLGPGLPVGVSGRLHLHLDGVRALA